MVTDCLPPDDRKSLFHAFYLVVHSINIYLVKKSNLHDLFLKSIKRLLIVKTSDVPVKDFECLMEVHTLYCSSMRVCECQHSTRYTRYNIKTKATGMYTYLQYKIFYSHEDIKSEMPYRHPRLFGLKSPKWYLVILVLLYGYWLKVRLRSSMHNLIQGHIHRKIMEESNNLEISEGGFPWLWVKLLW